VALPQPSEGGRGSMMALQALQPHLTMMVQLCQTISRTISSASALHYAVVFKYGKVLIRHEEEESTSEFTKIVVVHSFV